MESLQIKANGTNGNRLDRLIGYIAPSWLQKRELARTNIIKARTAANTYQKIQAAIDSAYDAGSVMDPVLQEWLPQTDTHPEQEIPSYTRKLIIGRCKDAYKNICVAKAVVDRLREHSIGLGLKLQSRVDADILKLTRDEAKKLNKKLEKSFHAAASSEEIDYERSLNFYELQDLVLLCTLLYGDVFVNTPYLERPGGLCNTKIQVIDSNRVDNELNTIDSRTHRKGIYLDKKTGAPTHIFVFDDNPFLGKATTGKKYLVFGRQTGRRRIFFIMEKELPGLTRGIPLLSNILKVIKQAGRYIDSEILAAVISSYFTVFLKKTSGTGDEYDLPLSSSSTPTTTVTGAKQIKMGPGMVNVIDEDMEMPVFANPTRPNPQTRDFLYMLLTLVGSSTGVPVELFLMHFETNYWAARASLNAFWHRVLKYRNIIAQKFCRAYYHRWLDEQVAFGKLELKVNYSEEEVRAAFMSHWEGPARDAINENQQAMGVSNRLGSRITTRQREAEQITGLDFEDILDQLEYEETELENRGLPVNLKAAGSREKQREV